MRSPESDAEQKHTYSDDDPYYSECSAFIDAVEAGAKSVLEQSESALADDDEDDNLGPVQTHDGILSSFRDACGTYALTWSVCRVPSVILRTAGAVKTDGQVLFVLDLIQTRAIKEASERATKTKKVDQLAE